MRSQRVHIEWRTDRNIWEKSIDERAKRRSIDRWFKDDVQWQFSWFLNRQRSNLPNLLKRSVNNLNLNHLHMIDKRSMDRRSRNVKRNRNGNLFNISTCLLDDCDTIIGVQMVMIHNKLLYKRMVKTDIYHY